MKLPHSSPLALALVGLVCATDTHALQTTFTLQAGYRSDALEWSIAGGRSKNAAPDVLSELTWDNLDIAQLALGVALDGGDGTQLRASASYGWIYDGHNRDSDYAANGRTGEWSRSDNETSDDRVIDASLALGRRLPFISSRRTFEITPLAGISFHEQKLRITDGFQTVSRPDLAPPGSAPAPLGPFAGLDSTYRARWFGPWVGIELASRSGSGPNGFVRLEHHWADYSATANWNLREDFRHPRSFEHDASGTGLVASAGIGGLLRNNWSATLSFDYQRWETDPGIDRVYLATGASASTRLNEVEWTSRAISIGFERRF